MQPKSPKCLKCVGNCPHCNGKLIRHGKSSAGKQRYYCKECNKTHVESYKYAAYYRATNQLISNLLKEGSGIRSIARFLSISVNTVLKRILTIARKLSKPPILFGKKYEVDELCTYVKQKTKLLWVAYAIRKDNREVVDFRVGRRTMKTLKSVTDTLLLSAATNIYTDKLQLYKYLLPETIHSTKQYGTNHIERMNLNLRTHLKRLNRRTICYSKSIAMLSACLKIYFWG